MPAAAVIPAPIAYIIFAAVKKLVVGFWTGSVGPPQGVFTGRAGLPSEDLVCSSLGVPGIQDFYCEKIRVFKAGLCLNTLAWNNKIGLWFYFVGF